MVSSLLTAQYRFVVMSLVASVFTDIINMYHHHHHHHMVFLEWPKQQCHHEDHYSQSKYEQYQRVL